jgi:hypothetical protein
MDGRERSAAAVRERIGPALTIVRDEAPDGHGLHRMIGDVDRAVVNPGRDAEQNHAVLCTELCRRLFHGLPRRQLRAKLGKSLLAPFGVVFAGRVGNPRACHSNRGSGRGCGPATCLR